MTMTFFMTDDDVLKLIADRPVREPLGKAKQWTRSRLVTTDVGDIPLLYLIAKEVFGDLLTDDVIPYWRDKDWTNESMDNVALMKLPSAKVKSKYGAPAGSPEYQRMYRQEHKAKLNAYHRERGRTIRAEAKAYREAQTNVVQAVRPDIATAVSEGEDLFAKLKEKLSGS